MQTTDWLVPLSSVVVALVTFGGVIYAARRNKEPRMSEVWSENDKLRDRLDTQDGKIDAQNTKIETLESSLETTNATFRQYKAQAETKIGILGAGFDALYRKFGSVSTEIFNRLDQDAVDAARALRLASNTHPIVLDLSRKED